MQTIVEVCGAISFVLLYFCSAGGGDIPMGMLLRRRHDEVLSEMSGEI